MRINRNAEVRWVFDQSNLLFISTLKHIFNVYNRKRTPYARYGSQQHPHSLSLYRYIYIYVFFAEYEAYIYHVKIGTLEIFFGN